MRQYQVSDYPSDSLSPLPLVLFIFLTYLSGGKRTLAPLAKENGDIDASIVHYRRAIDLKSDFSSAWLGLGVALAWLDREDEAIAAYKVLLV